MMKNDIITCIKEFMINEARSCSMDFGCVTPLYVFRMLGGTISIKEIEEGLAYVKEE